MYSFLTSPATIPWWDGLEFLSIIIVAFGCWGEYWAEKHKFTERPNDLMPAHHTNKRWEKSFWLMVVWGLGIELVAFTFSVLASNKEIAGLEDANIKSQQTLLILADELGTTTNAVYEATKRVAETIQQLSFLSTNLRELSHTYEVATNELNITKNSLAEMNRVRFEGQTNLIPDLERFANSRQLPIIVQINAANDGEAEEAANKLFGAVARIGWSVEGVNIVQSETGNGIRIESAMGSEGELGAFIILKAIIANGEGAGMIPDDDIPGDRVLVTVGRKPTQEQNKMMLKAGNYFIKQLGPKIEGQSH